MNELDAIALLLIVVSVILGWRSGAIPQVTGLLGAVAGGAIALFALPHLSGPISGVDPSVRPMVVLIGLVGAVAVGESLGAGLGRGLARRLGEGFLSAADRTVGAGFGAVQALLIVWLAGTLMAEGPIPRLAEAAGASTVVRAMASILPPPTEIAVGLSGLLDASGLPDVFVGFEPLPAAPVDRPADPVARAIAAVAEASTLKVTAATCGFSTLGTGFVTADSYVVTNAHVVAGARGHSVRVNSTGGRLLDAIPVLFDPSLDIALLYVPGLHAVPLSLARVDPGRGALGATLGYPGGGALTIVPAAITGRYPATGHDIYGAGLVRREILELRAAIDRGDSGGPLVLTDGTVGGVVFAEARTNPDVGYALSPTEVSARIAPAIGRQTAADTGACLRH
ncbi:MAG TPA: MarP family serine protease [Candidatus Limnocylindrales bacterium]|nr:MarP family serine protease [Candidatus Limnocylindrales bacterium]